MVDDEGERRMQEAMRELEADPLAHEMTPDDSDYLPEGSQELLFLGSRRGGGRDSASAAREGTLGPSANSGGDHGGEAALQAINTIRQARGLGAIGGLLFGPCDHSPFGCLECALRDATGASLIEHITARSK